MTTNKIQPPTFELRCGGFYMTLQRVPGLLVATLTTAVGSAIAAWFTTR